VERFSLLLLVARPLIAKNLGDARIPRIYAWGVSKIALCLLFQQRFDVMENILLEGFG
jgi:hypothetical protein